jgi:hypothetical protein
MTFWFESSSGRFSHYEEDHTGLPVFEWLCLYLFHFISEVAHEFIFPMADFKRRR